MASFVAEARERLAREVTLPDDDYIRWGGVFENLEAASRRRTIVAPVALGLVFAILCFTFGPLKPARIRDGCRATLVAASGIGYIGCVRTTVDTPESELEDAMRFTRARSRRERCRMAKLAKRAGSCPELVTAEELRRQRLEPRAPQVRTVGRAVVAVLVMTPGLPEGARADMAVAGTVEIK